MTQGRRYAVLIGSSRFDKEPNLRPLKYPENDVNGMHEILRARELGAFDEVAVFNNAESDPVLHKIEEILAAATGDDLFLIYYSGHGQTDLPGRLCLTTSDTEIRILLTTSIPVELLRSLIENSACRKVVLILDCCYSGAAGKSFTKGQVDEKLKDLARGNGIYILTASTASQPALEREGDDYGLLTKHIISGIRDGAADLNNDGVVSLNDLYRYVHQKVRDEGYQEPMYWALNVKGEDLIIARSGRFLIYKEHQQLSDKLIEIRDLLPPQILSRALDAIQNRRSPFYQLIDDLYLDRLRIGEFVEEWYRLDSGVPAPMLPAPQPHLAPERPAPIEAVVIEPSPVPALQPISPRSPATLGTIDFETVTLDFQGNELSRQTLQARYFIEELDGVSLEMVKIPGGSFTMGSPKDENNRHLNEWPQHQVTVPEFFMGRFQVTREQWRQVARMAKVTIGDLNEDISYFKDSWRQPVEYVTWEEAVEFCERLKQRTGKPFGLPTEAEWEYAARAGTTTPFAFGPTITPSLVNYSGISPYGSAPRGLLRGRTVEVGSLGLANTFGLFDMHGNVCEWCVDVWHGSYGDGHGDPPADGTAWLNGGDPAFRVLRGGAWNVNGSGCRSASRRRHYATDRINYGGFRVICRM